MSSLTGIAGPRTLLDSAPSELARMADLLERESPDAKSTGVLQGERVPVQVAWSERDYESTSVAWNERREL